MSGFISRLKSLWAYEPAALSWAVNGGVALVCAYVFGLSGTQEAAVATIVTALAAISTAVQARPVVIPAIVGALATAVTAAAAFGLHVSPDMIALGSSVVSGLLALLFRQSLTPVATIRAQRPTPAPEPPPAGPPSPPPPPTYAA